MNYTEAKHRIFASGTVEDGFAGHTQHVGFAWKPDENVPGMGHIICVHETGYFNWFTDACTRDEAWDVLKGFGRIENLARVEQEPTFTCDYHDPGTDTDCVATVRICEGEVELTWGHNRRAEHRKQTAEGRLYFTDGDVYAEWDPSMVDEPSMADIVGSALFDRLIKPREELDATRADIFEFEVLDKDGTANLHRVVQHYGSEESPAPMYELFKATIGVEEGEGEGPQELSTFISGWELIAQGMGIAGTTKQELAGFVKEIEAEEQDDA